MERGEFTHTRNKTSSSNILAATSVFQVSTGKIFNISIASDKTYSRVDTDAEPKVGQAIRYNNPLNKQVNSQATAGPH
ncbi:hypothetical protein E2C01_052387 [Portunus trituberculatus]|uniref:Uncharacterized protein n=1 Tax=Portunus trituberculatus TaxID=210409 RepID=A0A5B7GLQ0_PORTR|nr:hypothetical protein [Portunus trituberculatus]